MPFSPMQSPSILSRSKKPSTAGSISGRSAKEYLSLLQDADLHQRKVSGGSPAATPASSITSSSLTAFSDASSSRRSTSSGSSIMTSVYDVDVEENDEAGLLRPSKPPTSTEVFTTVHSEFGHCANQNHRHTSKYPVGVPLPKADEQDPPYYILITTYVSYIILICLGHVRDFFGKRFYPELYTHLVEKDGYAALNSDFDSFYTRRLKARFDDCFSRPVTGVAGRTIVCLDRESKDEGLTYQFTGGRTRALNVSSYNYLGFAQGQGACSDAVAESIKRYGISALGSRMEAGSLDLHTQTEALVARFIGQEDAVITSMGFATNSTNIPALVGKGCLVISDELNHASIRYGIRVSGASVRTFKHNDMKNLEGLLREVISQGQPKTHRPWKKILVIVEGLYSMEGTLLNLPALVELRSKYKFYLYVDEAHSVGALGPHGRGICDYFSIDPHSIDVLMGTFTKSFGASGGYIAGSKDLISVIRTRTHAGAYGEAMSPPVLTQIIASMSSIMGVADPISLRNHSASSSVSTLRPVSDDYTGPAPDSLLPSWLSLPAHIRDGSEGRERLRRLAFNVRYLAKGLRKLGFIVYGHNDSPIIPMLVFNPGKMPVFSRMMIQYKTPIVVVVVAYPATALVTARVRFCLSASHTKEDVDTLLRACDEVGTILDLKHAPGERWTVDQVIDNALMLVQATS